MNVSLSRFRTVPIWIAVAAAGLVFASMAAVATLSISAVTTSVQVTADTLSADSSSNVASLGITPTGGGVSAAGTASNSAVEATTLLPAVSPGIGANRWVYSVEVTESSAAAWSSSACYKAELFADGSPAGTAYFKNSTADSGNVEGVTFKVDAGSTGASSIASSWTSKVTAIASCS